MKRLSVVRYIAIGALVLIFAINCSGGSDSPVVPDNEDSGRMADAGSVGFGEFEISGDEIIFPVEYSDASDIYAMSFRVGYDSDFLEPVAVEWSSELINEDSTFHMLDRDGYIPLAFARYAPSGGLTGNGELCRLRFRMLGGESRNPWVIGDEEFLVARDSLGRHMRLRVRGGAR